MTLRLHSTLVAFVAEVSLKKLYICTPKSTRKYSHLTLNPSVSLLLHNCSNTSRDITDARALSISGIAQVLDGEFLEEIKQLYLKKHPQLEELVHSPHSAMIEISVQTCDDN